jgi:hypothetical protein
VVSPVSFPGIFWGYNFSIPEASGRSDRGQYRKRKKMTILDTIFAAWYSVVPLSTLAAILSFVFIEEIIYTFTANWDMVQ